MLFMLAVTEWLLPQVTHSIFKHTEVPNRTPIF